MLFRRRKESFKFPLSSMKNIQGAESEKRLAKGRDDHTKGILEGPAKFGKKEFKPCRTRF